MNKEATTWPHVVAEATILIRIHILGDLSNKELK